jgi:peptide/nickel transport system permease protein
LIISQINIPYFFACGSQIPLNINKHFRHVLRNALNPLLSTIGYAFAGLLSGSLLVENVMNYPGLGRLVYEAFIREDQFVVLGSVVVGCSLLIIGNLLSDLALAWSDSRVRYGR